MDMEDDMVPLSLNTPEKSNSTNIYNVVSPNNDNGLNEKAESGELACLYMSAVIWCSISNQNIEITPVGFEYSL
jgi:hypothetical protein